MFPSTQQLDARHLAAFIVPLLMFGEALGGDEALPTPLAFVRFIVIHLLVVLQVPDP